MSQAKTFGHIPNYPTGTTFKTRKQLLDAGVHGMIQAGIHGDTEQGAYSICLSGGYEDNTDDGERIIYVGSGGQDDSGTQTANQSMDDPLNKSLWISNQTKRPVRVIRGKNNNSFYSPKNGFRYDGLYVVRSAEMRLGKKGFQMCTFRLERLREEGDGPIPTRRLLGLKKLANISRQAGRK